MALATCETGCTNGLTMDRENCYSHLPRLGNGNPVVKATVLCWMASASYVEVSEEVPTPDLEDSRTFRDLTFTHSDVEY